MAWEAIHCDRALEHMAIVQAIAEALGVDDADLSVAERIELARPDARVLIAARVNSGDYPQSIDIITSDDTLTLARDALRLMITRWGCRALLADDHDNPYRMVLVTPGAADVTVYVDAEAFDEREQLIVAGPASVRPEPPIPEAPRSQRRPTPPPPRKP